MTRKLTESSNTKKEFVKAYNDQLVEIEQLKAALSDPKKELEEKEKNKVIADSETILNSNVPDSVKKLQTEMNSILEKVVSNVLTSSDELKTLNDTIEIKKQELKELFDIEDKAYSLTALINAEKQYQIDHQIKMDERKFELNKMLADLNLQINNAKDTLDSKLLEIDKQVIAERDKKYKELDYEISRKKIVDNDLWADEKKKRETELAEKEKEYEDKLAELVNREQRLNELEEKVNSIPQLLDEVKQQAFEEGKEKAEKIEGYKTKAMETKFNAEKSVLEREKEMLEERLAESNRQLEQCKSDLRDAYDKMNETAKATVEAGANKNIISQFQSVLESKNKNN